MTTERFAEICSRFGLEITKYTSGVNDYVRYIATKDNIILAECYRRERFDKYKTSCVAYIYLDSKTNIIRTDGSEPCYITDDLESKLTNLLKRYKDLITKARLKELDNDFF
ncbi:MAG: hypothetical protein J6T10_01330 [Methanobrevibacter sp.]|nr:hypothetical protein [Methanobrevibacter sp.]